MIMDIVRKYAPMQTKGRKGRPLEFKVLTNIAYLSSQGDMWFPAALMGCSKPEVSRFVALISGILSHAARQSVNSIT